MARQSTRAGGIFLPIGIFGGLLIGAVAGQPIVGLLIGTAAGIAGAIWLWISDRKRKQKH